MCVRNRDTRRPRCGFTGAGRRELHQRVRRVEDDEDDDATRELDPRRDTASLGERGRRDRGETVRIQLGTTKTMLARDARETMARMHEARQGKANSTAQDRHEGTTSTARGVRRGLI